VSFLKIFSHQYQNRLCYRLPCTWIWNLYDLLRHLHRFWGQVRRALSVNIERFQRRPAGMWLHHYCITNYARLVHLNTPDQGGSLKNKKLPRNISKEPLQAERVGFDNSVVRHLQ
jgi:hypothetical protein